MRDGWNERWAHRRTGQAASSVALHVTAMWGPAGRFARRAAAGAWAALIVSLCLVGRAAVCTALYIRAHAPVWVATARHWLGRLELAVRRAGRWAGPKLVRAARTAGRRARWAATGAAGLAREAGRRLRTHAPVWAGTARQGLQHLERAARRAGRRTGQALATAATVASLLVKEGWRYVRTQAPVWARTARQGLQHLERAARRAGRRTGQALATAATVASLLVKEGWRYVRTQAPVWVGTAREGLRLLERAARRAGRRTGQVLATAATVASWLVQEGWRHVRTQAPVWAGTSRHGLRRVDEAAGDVFQWAKPMLVTAGRTVRWSATEASRLAVEAWRNLLAHAPSWMAAAGRGVERVLAGVLPQLRRAGAELRHQIREAQEVRPSFRPLRDRHGRRLRASAYARHRGTARRGGDLARVRYRAGLRTAGAILVTLAVVGMGSFLGGSRAFVDFSADLPDVHILGNSPLAQDTLIYAADGTQLADIHDPGVLHYEQSLNQMGSLLPEAVVAVEDANFWKEPGVDPQGIARAALANFEKGHAVQGASTITQQLARVRLLKDRSVTYQRKIKEAILALQIERTYSKRQILEMYLNSVHFGNQSLGAEAAAQDYFRKDTRDLNLAEASMLAGIPQSPYYNDPLRNWDVARMRQREVLDAMVRHGAATPGEASEAYATDLRPELHYPPESIKAAPDFVSWTVKQLIARYGRPATLEGGLRVFTTLNPALQGIAESTVRGNVDNNRSKNIQQGAMTAIDPRTGEVLAMVGSAYPDRLGGQYNYAADVPRNPGSSFKIFTYTAGIDSHRYVMDTPIQDNPITVNMPGQEQGYQPKNYNGKFGGTCALQVCMGNSLNVPAVQVEVSTGVDQVVNMARKLGAPPFMPHLDGRQTQDDPATSFGASLTLGGYGETPLQMATGAATIADMGLYHPATSIVRITDWAGDTLFNYDPAQVARQVLDPRVAYIMQTIMSNDDNRAAIFGRGSALTLPGRPAGAKTGTTDDWRDAWTVGYTPSMASAFWFGNADYSPMEHGYDAIFAAAPAWRAYMGRALDTLHVPPAEWFAAPPGLVHDGNLWLLPGTSPHQAGPPLPPWAKMDAPPKPPSG